MFENRKITAFSVKDSEICLILFSAMLQTAFFAQETPASKSAEMGVFTHARKIQTYLGKPDKQTAKIAEIKHKLKFHTQLCGPRAQIQQHQQEGPVTLSATGPSR